MFALDSAGVALLLELRQIVRQRPGAELRLRGAGRNVREVLERFSETEKTLHPMTRLGHVKSVELGPPRWAIAVEDGKAVLRFEVRFDPLVYERRATELEAEIARSICAVDPLTRRFAGKNQRRLVVRAVPTQTLKALTERYD